MEIPKTKRGLTALLVTLGILLTASGSESAAARPRHTELFNIPSLVPEAPPAASVVDLGKFIARNQAFPPELADTAKAAVAVVGGTGPNTIRAYASGVKIAPHQVLTAPHVAKALQDARLCEGAAVHFTDIQGHAGRTAITGITVDSRRSTGVALLTVAGSEAFDALPIAPLADDPEAALSAGASATFVNYLYEEATKEQHNPFASDPALQAPATYTGLVVPLGRILTGIVGHDHTRDDVFGGPAASGGGVFVDGELSALVIAGSARTFPAANINTYIASMGVDMTVTNIPAYPPDRRFAMTFVAPTMPDEVVTLATTHQPAPPCG
jgi:hypothetical protein